MNAINIICNRSVPSPPAKKERGVNGYTQSSAVTWYSPIAHFQPEATVMHANELEAPVQTVIYPDSDGKPMADNTLQFRWIVTIVGNLEDLYADDPNVFIAGDLLWYPVEGNSLVRLCDGRISGWAGTA